MNVVSKVLGLVRAKRQTEQSAALKSYDELARALAAGREVDPEQVDALLRASLRPLEDLERDVAALVEHRRQLEAARRVPKLELDDLAARGAEVAARAAAGVAAARANELGLSLLFASSPSSSAQQAAEGLLRLAGAGLSLAWSQALSDLREAASKVHSAESLRLGWDRSRDTLATKGEAPPSDAALEELKRRVEVAKGKAEQAWTDVLTAAAKVPLEALVGGEPKAEPVAEASWNSGMVPC